LNFESAINLAIYELELIATRIRQYRLIETYPRYFTSVNHEVFAAFISHLHTLRSNELYLIQERSAELLKFCFKLADDLNLQTSDQSAKYNRAFKKCFERRLRERHRLIHSHERPSLLTRMLDVVAGIADKAILADAIGEVAATMYYTYAALKSGANDLQVDQARYQEIQEEMKQIYTRGFDEEAAVMWEMIASHFRASFSIFSGAE
jgi:hypothetical protein